MVGWALLSGPSVHSETVFRSKVKGEMGVLLEGTQKQPRIGIYWGMKVTSLYQDTREVCLRISVYICLA